mgnify:CR=1 FL=1
MCKLNAQDRATLEKAKAQAAELVEALDLQQQAISIEKRLGAIQSVTE